MAGSSGRAGNEAGDSMTRRSKDPDPAATIFEIERYATEDGPGIRSVVFFKGCNLRCQWCQNPESQSLRPQIMYYRNLCAACGRCVQACPRGAIREIAPLGYITDHQKCTVCGACVDACFSAARKIVGRRLSLDAIMEELRRDRLYYEQSGGGVTFSGGEPLLQPKAAAELARRCRSEGIHTALETAGHVPWRDIEDLLPWLDLMYFDLKHIDSEAHRRHTGVPLELILENLRRVSECDENLIVRIPVVPGVNATQQTMSRMFAFLAEKTQARCVELLPFHRLGLSKYEGLGLAYAMAEVGNLSGEECASFAEIGRVLGLSVQVGRAKG
jgi:pyruvate formate lyase activating enzyme